MNLMIMLIILKSDVPVYLDEIQIFSSKDERKVKENANFGI